MTVEKITKETNENKYRILAGNMWAIYNFDNPNTRYQKFLLKGRTRFKSFIENVILYDEIVVPTQDFLSLTLLIDVFGEKPILDLLSTNNLKFLRLNGAIGYIGNGGGIKSYEISLKPNGISNQPFCAPIDEAISWALNVLKEKPKEPTLQKKILNATAEVKIKSIAEEIRHETYMDILQSNYLRSLFGIRNKDLDHLVGIEPNQGRIYGGKDVDSWKGDEIDLVMLLATTNTELNILNKIENGDLISENPIGHILKAKDKRTFGIKKSGEIFTELLQIAGIPDIGEGVLKKQFDIKSLLTIKQSRDGEKFREWFHSNVKKNPKAVTKEYINLIKQVSKIDTLPMRIIRFLSITTIAFRCNFLTATIATAFDSFFLKHIIRDSSPKFFIDSLDQISKSSYGIRKVLKKIHIRFLELVNKIKK